MLAAEAIEGAIAFRSPREKTAAVEILAEWSGSAGWRLLRNVTALRSLLGDMFVCPVEIVGAGHGCFYARYALDLDPRSFTDRLEASGRHELARLKSRFDVNKMSVRANGTTLTIF